MVKKLGLILSAILLVIASLTLAAPPALATTHTVNMGANQRPFLRFEPEKLTIKTGETVEFVMNKLAPHNVIFEDHPELSHQKLLYHTRNTYKSTFKVAGEYKYYCKPHRGAGMQGTIIVK